MATNALPAPQTRKLPKLTAAAAAEMAVPLAVLAIVVALITPMPPFLLDLLLVIDIMLSVIVLMVSLYLNKAVEFSVFPTTLLILTLFRLALNVSSSRLDLDRYHALGHRPDGFPVFEQSCGVQRLSHYSAYSDALPSRSQCLLLPAHS